MRGDGDHACVRADELFEIVRIADRDVVFVMLSQQGSLENPQPPPACSGPEPSVLCSTSRHLGYFLFRMPSSHIGRDAMLICMKYPAWSIDSVNGAVNTMSLPPFMALPPIRPRTPRRCRVGRIGETCSGSKLPQPRLYAITDVGEVSFSTETDDSLNDDRIVTDVAF
mgnify:CR=1 FL=1